MGILTYVKIGLAVIVLGFMSFYVWNYHRMQRQIEVLKEQNASLALGQQIILEAQKRGKETRQKVQVIIKKGEDENAKVRQEEAGGNTAALDNRLDQLSGLHKNKGGSPTSR